MTVIQSVQTGPYQPERGCSQGIDALRIVNWNINRGLQLGGIIDFLKNAAADVILLQETDINARRTQYRNVPREIADALRMRYVFGYEFEELAQGRRGSPAYHGQTTLSRFPISASRVVRFRRQSGFWRPRWFIPKLAPLQRRHGARIALVSHIECSENQLVVYNVHLESRGTDELRLSQLQEVFEDADQYSAHVPLIIAGDMNFDLSKTAMVRPFDVPFNHGHKRPTTAKPRFGDPRSVDWILARNSVENATPELHDYVRASDHYPLSLILKLK